MNDLITILICVTIGIALWRMGDIIKHVLTIRARERADAAYEARKKKEREDIERYNSREEQAKRQFGNNIRYWFSFNGISFWCEKDVFYTGVAYGHEIGVRNKIIKKITEFDEGKTNYFVSFWQDEKKPYVVHWEYVPMDFKQEPAKQLKSNDEIADETITKFDELLTKN